MEKCDLYSVFLTDKNGLILETFYDNINISKYTNGNLLDIIQKENYLKFIEFIKTTISKTVEFSWEINVNIFLDVKPLYFTGVFYDDKILVLVSGCNREPGIVYEELNKINENLSPFIGYIKEYSEDINQKDYLSSNLLNQISHLNNELSNLQRDLAKKNIELEKRNTELSELSFRDSLTGLYNRRFFYEIINNEVGKIKRLNYNISLISVDINNFKTVNDRYGHTAGDELLKSFKEISLKNTRSNIDYVFRFGGDEFIFLLNNVSKDDSHIIINRINEVLQKIYDFISLSYGIVMINYSNSCVDIDKILQEADNKMYSFKTKHKSESPS